MRSISKTPLRAISAMVFMALATVSPAQASDEAMAPPTMEQIEQAWKQGDYDFVRKGLEQLAQDPGTALAQYRYGRVLIEGRGGPKDIEGAVDWLTKAAGKNQTEALTLLARIYLSNIPHDHDHSHDHGHDISETLKRDPKKAADLLSRAAALGHAEAQYYLAMLYSNGDGVAQDDGAAFTWMLAAAQQEYTEAAYELSHLYSRGIGTEPNPDEALRWLTRAGSNDHVKAQYFLAAAYESGRGVEQNLIQAVDWYRRAAENGLPIAQRNLGTHYLQGEAVTQNVEEGLRWLHAAAKAGDSGAMGNLGVAYATGMGVERDDATAADWYNKASEYGLGRAKVALALFHETGRGVEQDLDRAITLYEQALETSDAGQAATQLARLLSNGTLDGRIAPHRAVPWALYAAQNGDAPATSWLAKQAEAGLRDAQAGLAALYLDNDEKVAEGSKLLEQAAAGGDTASQTRLGRMYMTGSHVALDYVTAHKWFNIAATLGESEAAELRETVGDLMTPEELADAQSAARHWFEQEQPQPPATQQSVRVTSE